VGSKNVAVAARKSYGYGTHLHKMRSL